MDSSAQSAGTGNDLANVGYGQNQNQQPTSTDDGFYSIEDLLPIPNETLPGGNMQSSGGMPGDSNMTAGPSTIGFNQLSDPIRTDFQSLEDRFSFEPNVEVMQDAFVVKCTLSKYIMGV